MRKSVALGAMLAVALVGCAGEAEPEPTPAPTPSETQEPEAAPTAPLTGMIVDTALTTPVLAAKIDNHPRARPQIGIDRADIVFEELVEGGLTRYVALWHSDVPESIGPVRSIRPMDPSIVAPFGGIVAYSGGQQRFVSLMQETELANAVEGGDFAEYFSRTQARYAPHNVLLEASRIVADTDTLAPPNAYFSYAEPGMTPTASTPVETISVTFSPGEDRGWTCASDSHAMVRDQNGVVDTAEGGAELTATNVVLLSVSVIDNQDVPETVYQGEGTGVVVSGCASVPVRWSKPDRDSAVELTTQDGAPVLLRPGNTWVELVPNSGNFALN